MGFLLPHAGPAWTSQHSELHENHFKDDLKNHFEDDLALSMRKRRFQRWSSIFDDKKEDFKDHKEDVGNHVAFEWARIAALCSFWCPHSKNTQLMSLTLVSGAGYKEAFPVDSGARAAQETCRRAGMIACTGPPPQPRHYAHKTPPKMKLRSLTVNSLHSLKFP